MKNNFPNFAQDFDDEPVGALATDVGKEIPVLRGEDAERFIRNMALAEREAEERSKRPKTRQELESEISIKKMLLDFQEREVEELRKEIKKLEELHAKTEEE